MFSTHKHTHKYIHICISTFAAAKTLILVWYFKKMEAIQCLLNGQSVVLAVGTGMYIIVYFSNFFTTLNVFSIFVKFLACNHPSTKGKISIKFQLNWFCRFGCKSTNTQKSYFYILWIIEKFRFIWPFFYSTEREREI